jgi:hypothetical protein
LAKGARRSEQGKTKDKTKDKSKKIKVRDVPHATGRKNRCFHMIIIWSVFYGLKIMPQASYELSFCKSIFFDERGKSGCRHPAPGGR